MFIRGLLFIFFIFLSASSMAGIENDTFKKLSKEQIQTSTGMEVKNVNIGFMTDVWGAWLKGVNTYHTRKIYAELTNGLTMDCIAGIDSSTPEEIEIMNCQLWKEQVTLGLTELN